MPVYIQEEKPRLQCGEKRATVTATPTATIDNDPAHDDDDDNDENDIFAKSRSSFQPHHHHHASSHPRLEVAALPLLQSKFIDDTMNDIRKKELAAVAATTTAVTTAVATTAATSATAINNNHDRGQDDVVGVARNKKRKISSGASNSSSSSSSDNNWTSIFLDRLSSNLDTAQIVATSGGLVSYWNEKFCNITKSSATRLRNFPLTIFELIEPHTLPKLYAMLALALHDIGIVVEEENSEDSDSLSSSSFSSNSDDMDERRCDCDDSGRSSALTSVGHHSTTTTPPSSSHLSITLPCKSFRGDPTSRYNITIIFMHDLSSRCFVGILTPQVPLSSIIPDNVVSSINNTICDDDEYGQEEEEVHSPIKKTTTETAVQARSSSLLPIGRMLRIRDDVLCQMIYDTE